MISKVKTGVDFFDQAYGGTYQGRVTLVTGRSGSGKTILGLQFIAQGLKQGERCLLLSARPAEDVALFAAAFGISVDAAIEKGDLIILEYSEFVPGRDREDQLKLPPDSFIQLKQIIEEQAVQRVVLDTVLPWVALNDEASLAEHIFSFVRVFHRLGTTSLFTLPKPMSAPAIKLRRMIEEVVPVSISLTHSADEHKQQWQVSKYLGSDPATEPIDIEIKQAVGIVKKASTPRVEERKTSFVESRPPPPRSTPPPTTRRDEGKNKPSFSDLMRMDGSSGSGPTNTGWGSLASATLPRND